MLNEYCPKGCNVPLVRSRQGERCCVVCEPEPGAASKSQKSPPPAASAPSSQFSRQPGVPSDFETPPANSPQLTPTPEEFTGGSPQGALMGQPLSFSAPKDDASSTLHTPSRLAGPGPLSGQAPVSADRPSPVMTYAAPPRRAAPSAQSSPSDFSPLTTTLLTRLEAYRAELENMDPGNDLERQHKLIVMMKDTTAVLSTLKDFK